MAKDLNISKQAYWNKEKGRTPFTDKEKIIIKNKLTPIFPDITIDAIFFANEVLKSSEGVGTNGETENSSYFAG